MKNWRFLSIMMLCMAVLFSSCGTWNNTAKGTAIGVGGGAAAGAGIGAIAGNTALGEVIGAAVGGFAVAMLISAARQDEDDQDGLYYLDGDKEDDSSKTTEE